MAGSLASNRAVIAAACSFSVAACALSAPDELGGVPAGGRNAGGESSGGNGAAATAGTSLGGKGVGEGGTSSAGEAGAGGAGAEPSNGGASGEDNAPGGTGGSAAGSSGAVGEGGDGGPGGDCVEGLVRDGTACRLPRSCHELHLASPELGSGPYALQPVGAAESFRSYCGMANEGGGWTLAVNEGTSFDPTTTGVTTACYSSSCTNVAYARLPLDSDVMIDISNEPIVTSTYTARIIVSGVHAMSRGKTLRTLFTTGPHYLDTEDNSNVAVRMIGGAACSTLPTDFADLVCEDCTTPDCTAPVLVFGDFDSAASCRAVGAAVPKFAIGGAYAYDKPWTNCAGWPQDPNRAADFYPDYVRVWIR